MFLTTGWGTEPGIFMREEEWRSLEASFFPAPGVGSAVLGLPVGVFLKLVLCKSQLRRGVV